MFKVVTHVCASAQSPCSLLSVETLSIQGMTAYPGYLVRCSFAAEHVFHFQSSLLLAQSLAAIPQDFLREQQMQAKFKTLKVAHERYKDSTQSSNLLMLQSVSSSCLVYLGFPIENNERS